MTMNNKEIFNNERSPLLNFILGKKKFLINNDFQINFISSLILISIVSMSIIYFSNNYFFHTYLQRGRDLNLPPDHPFFLMIYEQKRFMAKVLISVMASISSIIFLWGLFFSHKIAGPLYRLKNYFDMAATEQAPLKNKIYFRKNDFFQEVPDAINRYIENLNNPKNKEKEEIEKDKAS